MWTVQHSVVPEPTTWEKSCFFQTVKSLFPSCAGVVVVHATCYPHLAPTFLSPTPSPSLRKRQSTKMVVTQPTPLRIPHLDNNDMDSDSESTTTTTSTFLTPTTLTSTPFPAATPTPTASNTPLPPLLWNNPLPLTRLATPTPNQTYLLLHVASQRVLSLLHGVPTLVSSPPPNLHQHQHQHPNPHATHQVEEEQTLGCPNWTLTASHGYLGLRSCASGTFLGRDLPGRVVAQARGHGSWEAFVVLPVASVSGTGVDYGGGGGGYYVLMCINYVAGCLERVGVRDRGEGGGGDGLGILLEGVGEGAVWEFVGVGGGG